MLPNADRARVDREKITGYLLSSGHPVGRFKARFFEDFGFRVEEWQVLSSGLVNHATTHPVVSLIETEHGTHYVVEGVIQTPDGRNPAVRTVWIIEPGNATPRLVTAYPLRG